MLVKCATCRVLKDTKEFYKHSKRPNGCQAYCKLCHQFRAQKTNKQYWLILKNDPIKYAAYLAKCRQKNTEKGYRRKYNAECREATFTAYGNVCACCGETNKLFLTLDHINNDGAAHRKSIRSSPRQGCGQDMYQWAKKNSYPDILQLLCFNCNCGKQRNNGICPHNDFIN